MYIPKHFEGSEPTGREIMQAHSWALLLTAGEDGAPIATHLALLWQDDGSEHGSLIGHMARASGVATRCCSGLNAGSRKPYSS